jgi:hypothetical protein
LSGSVSGRASAAASAEDDGQRVLHCRVASFRHAQRPGAPVESPDRLSTVAGDFDVEAGTGARPASRWSMWPRRARVVCAGAGAGAWHSLRGALVPARHRPVVAGGAADRSGAIFLAGGLALARTHALAGDRAVPCARPPSAA